MAARLLRREEWWRAGLTLAAAVGLAVASERLYVYGEAGAGLASALAAVFLCGRVLVLSAKRLLSGLPARRVRLPFRTPVTLQGAAFLSMLVLVGFTAAYSGNNLVYLTASAMLAALAASSFVSRLNSDGLNLRVSLPDHLFAGRATNLRVSIENGKRRLASYSLRAAAAGDGVFDMETVYVAAVGPGERVGVAARATFARRGTVRGAAVTLTSAFPFGFFERRRELVLSSDLVVFPSVEFTDEARKLLRQFEEAAAGRSIGESHDLYRIRPARHGDSARFLDWKASARGGGLWVREYARDDRRRATILFDRRVPSDEPSEAFERRVALCAAVAWRLAEWRSALVFSTDEAAIRAEPDSEGVYEILRYLATVRPTGERSAAPTPVPASSDEPAPEVAIGPSVA